MAPKVEQPAVADVPGIIAALQGDEQDKLVAALSSLFTLNAAQLPQDEAAATELVTALQGLLASSHAAEIRGAAIKCAARLISIPGSACQQCLMSESTGKAAWTFLSEVDAVWPQYLDKLPQVLSAARGEQTGKKPTTPAAGKSGAATALDPEAALPGPSKQTLDAALRVLCILATQDATGLLGWVASGIPADSTESSHQASYVQALSRLLSYHSTRVQCRAVQLCTVLLAAVPDVEASLLHLGAVPDLCRLIATSGHACVRLRALQALHVLLQHPSAAYTQLLQAGAMPTLLQLASATVCMPAAAITGETSAPPGTPAVVSASRPITPLTMTAPSTPAPIDTSAGQQQAVDFARPFPASLAELQMEALRVLTLLTHFSQAATEQAVKQGGVQLLLAMLPPAPARQPPAAAALAGGAVLAPNSTAQVAGQPGALLEQPLQPDVAAEIGAGAADGCGDACPTSRQDEVSPAAQEFAQWQACLASPPPTVPSLPSSAAQSQALKLLQNLVSVPAVQDITVKQQQAIDALAVPRDVGAPCSNAITEQDSVPSADPTAAVQAAGTELNGPLLPLLDQLLTLFAGAPAAAAPLTPEPSKAVPKPTKPGKGKNEEPAPTPAHLLPPFPAPVRAAALHVLAALCHSACWAKTLSSHPQIIQILRAGGQHLPSELPVATEAPSGTTASTAAPGSTTAAPAAQASAQASQQTPEQVAEVSTQAVPVDKELLHGVALLTQALAAQQQQAATLACVGYDAQQPQAASGSLSIVNEDLAGLDAIVSVTGMLAKATLADKLQAVSSQGAAVDADADYLLRTAVASSIVAVPDAKFIAMPRPPLPSPPPTPPPLPLATTMFLWDALDRPMMADGSVKLVRM